MASAFIGKLKSKKGHEATIVRSKNIEDGTLRYSLYKHAKEIIDKGEDPRKAVKVPESDTFEDWLAVHVVDFFNRLQLFYSVVEDHCTEESCPTMSGGRKVQYLWQDDIKVKVTQ